MENSNIYREAKKQFGLNSNEFDIIGRDKEKEVIKNFLTQHIESNTGGALYLGGQPGSGKTFVTTHILKKFELEYPQVKFFEWNCKTTKFSFSKIQMDSKSSELKVLLLDEMDSLEQSIVDEVLNMTTFEKLILIGIGNTLNFHSKIIARGWKSDVLPFPPYGKIEIASIVKKKLANVKTETKLFDDMAIQLLAVKLDNHGDLRKVFDICRQCIDLLERNPNVPKITPTLLLQIISKNLSQSPTDKIPTLPLHQKITLLACSEKPTEISKVYQQYTKYCRKKPGLKKLTASEFQQICNNLECFGLLLISKGKKIALQAPKDEVNFFLVKEKKFFC